MSLTPVALAKAGLQLLQVFLGVPRPLAGGQQRLHLLLCPGPRPGPPPLRVQLSPRQQHSWAQLPRLRCHVSYFTNPPLFPPPFSTWAGIQPLDVDQGSSSRDSARPSPDTDAAFLGRVGLVSHHHARTLPGGSRPFCTRAVSSPPAHSQTHQVRHSFRSGWTYARALLYTRRLCS